MRRSGMLRSTAVFSAMTLLSRLLGLARESLQASLFGVSAAMDAFQVAYRIPNFLRRVFAEGSFSSAFVPVLTEIRQKNDAAALKDFVDHVAGALCAVVLLTTALGIALAPVIVGIFAPGMLDEPEKFRATYEMLRITFPYLFFISLTALAGGILNSLGRFALPAVTPVLHNLAVIAAMFLLAGYFDVPVKALAWGVFAAGALQLALLWPALRRFGLMPRLRLDFKHEGVRRVFRLMLPTVFSSSVAQVNLLVGTIFASLLVTGSQTWLALSDRLIELPLGLFGVALGTVILPQLARKHADTDAAGYSTTLDWGLRMVLLLAVPAALGLFLLAEPLTATLYNYGRFTDHDTRMAALAVAAMSLGVPAFMLTKVLLPAFYARQDTRTPMRAAIQTVAINVALTILIVTPLWWYQVEGAHAGIALATGIAGMANAGLLAWQLRRAGIYRRTPGWGRFFVRVGSASAAMVVTVWLLRDHVGDWSALAASGRVMWLLLAVAAGAVSYGAVLLLVGLRPRHLREH